jgi:hypothetical protein
VESLSWECTRACGRGPPPRGGTTLGTWWLARTPHAPLERPLLPNRG